jgi:hypothetical protein
MKVLVKLLKVSLVLEVNAIHSNLKIILSRKQRELIKL